MICKNTLPYKIRELQYQKDLTFMFSMKTKTSFTKIPITLYFFRKNNGSILYCNSTGILDNHSGWALKENQVKFDELMAAFERSNIR